MITNSALTFPQFLMGIVHFFATSNVERYKAFAKELKTIYTALDEKTALSQLDMVSEKWETHYPGVLNRWRENWDAIS